MVGDGLRSEDLRRYTRRALSTSMVLSAFVMLDRLPVMSNGKLDRAALPDPAGGTGDLARYRCHGRVSVPPRGALETRLVVPLIAEKLDARIRAALRSRELS